MDPSTTIAALSSLARALSGPGSERADADDLLADIALPDAALAVVRGPLLELGWKIELVVRPDRYTARNRHLTAARNGSTEVFLLHLPKPVLQSEAPRHVEAIVYLRIVLGDGCVAFIFSADLDAPHPTFDAIFRTLKRDHQIDCRFRPWSHLITLAETEPARQPQRLTQILELEGLAAPGIAGNGSGRTPRATSPPPVTELQQVPRAVSPNPGQLDEDDIRRLIEIIAPEATIYMDGPPAYFNELLARANVPRAWRDNQAGQWPRDARAAARRLIEWAWLKGQNPIEPAFQTLGAVLRPLLDDVGLDRAIPIVATIVRYRLYHSPDEYAKLKRRYAVPEPASANAAEYATDLFDELMLDEPDDVELQGLFRTQPLVLDVPFITAGIERGLAVCRVETEQGTPLGTGFLIADYHVVTNKHVLTPPGREPIDPATVVLSFGATTASAPPRARARPDAAAPVVRESPAHELDYVLMRVHHEAAGEKPPPLRFEPGPLPGRREGLNILQHAAGDALSMAISGDGVVKVDAVRSVVQYVSQTAGGSSGSPCFDDDWRLIAMHRAERSRRSGTIREGILFAAIHEEIRQVLAP